MFYAVSSSSPSVAAVGFVFVKDMCMFLLLLFVCLYVVDYRFTLLFFVVCVCFISFFFASYLTIYNVGKGVFRSFFDALTFFIHYRWFCFVFCRKVPPPVPLGSVPIKVQLPQWYRRTQCHTVSFRVQDQTKKYVQYIIYTYIWANRSFNPHTHTHTYIHAHTHTYTHASSCAGSLPREGIVSLHAITHGNHLVRWGWVGSTLVVCGNEQKTIKRGWK